MDKQAQEELNQEMNDWLRASAGSFDFWDNDLDAEYDTPAPLPATVARPLALLTDDYEEMLRWSGSLGVVEL